MLTYDHVHLLVYMIHIYIYILYILYIYTYYIQLIPVRISTSSTKRKILWRPGGLTQTKYTSFPWYIFFAMPRVIHYVKRKTGPFEEPNLWGCNSLRAGWATCQAIARISARQLETACLVRGFSFHPYPSKEGVECSWSRMVGWTEKDLRASETCFASGWVGMWVSKTSWDIPL